MNLIEPTDAEAFDLARGDIAAEQKHAITRAELAEGIRVHAVFAANLLGESDTSLRNDVNRHQLARSQAHAAVAAALWAAFQAGERS